MVGDENQPKQTEEVSAYILSDNMATLRNATEFLGMTEQQALNQAVWLWTMFASQGWIGKKVSIVTEEVMPPRTLSRRKQAVLRFLNRIGVQVTRRRTREWTLSLVLSGTSPEELTEDALRKLQQED